MKSSTMNNCYAYKNMFNAAAESGPKLFIGNLSHTSEFLATAIPFPRLSTWFFTTFHHLCPTPGLSRPGKIIVTMDLQFICDLR